MKRMKVLGIAMLAVFAISAIAVSAAQAAEFHSEIEKTFLFGEQEGENIFTTTAGNVKCSKATFDSLNAQVGTGSGTNFKTNTVIVQPQYSTCKAFGQTEVYDNPPSQTGNACDYHFTGSTGTVKVSGTPVPTSGTASCELKITVAAGNCNLVLNNQTPSTPTVAFLNTTFAGKSAIKEVSAVAGITYTVEGAAGSICGEPGVHTDGKYSGVVVERGYKSGTHTEAEQVGVRYE